MNPIWIIWPQLAHMGLTLGLLIWLGMRRVQAAKEGQVTLREIALNSKAWPERIVQIGNNYQSQFELPVLFHILCILFFVQGAVSGLAVSLAWGFVITRCVHSVIHITSNHVIRRFQAFVAGLVIIVLMAVTLAVGLLIGN